MGGKIQIHVLTNTVIQSRWSHRELAAMAFDGGADVVQFRHKSPENAPSLSEIRQMATLSRRPDQYFIVNDDVELALEAGADGAHVGAEDMPAAKARILLGPDAFLGATVHNLAELEALRGIQVNYIGVGPVFGTASKDTGLPPLGLEGLAEICKSSPWPVIGIGNIHRNNAAEVIAAGASGIAVLSEVCLAENPQKAVEELRKILD